MRKLSSLEDHLPHLERAASYLEENLTRPIGLENIAWAAALSPFHFHRIFLRAVGCSAIDYLRQRRLTEAAAALRTTDKGCGEIGLTHGYSSPEAFTRAFEKQFYVLPTTYRQAGIARNLLPFGPLPCRAHTPGPACLGLPVARIAPAQRWIGLVRTGEHRHATNVELMHAYIRQAQRVPHRVCPGLWAGWDRFAVAPQPEAYEYFFGEQVAPLAPAPVGMVALDIPQRREAVVEFQGSLRELEQIAYTYLYHTLLPQYGWSPIPGAWKTESYLHPGGNLLRDVMVIRVPLLLERGLELFLLEPSRIVPPH